MVLVLTSCLDLYTKDEFNNRIPQHFGNKNNILKILKENTKKFDNFLFVSNGFPDEISNPYFEATVKSFEMTLPFKNYYVLNNETRDSAKKLVKDADFIFLCGGHLPTQNKFFKEINLKALLQNTTAIVVGGSAGSMNCAETVYCPPEIEGESLDKNFKRFFSGLGLTKINILPHFDTFQDFVLDDKDFIKDIILPDTTKVKVIALNDGSYILCQNGTEQIYGESYILENGKIVKFSELDETVDIKF